MNVCILCELLNDHILLPTFAVKQQLDTDTDWASTAAWPTKFKSIYSIFPAKDAAASLSPALLTIRPSKFASSENECIDHFECV